MEVVASILGSVVAEAGRVPCGSICSDINDRVRIQSNVRALQKEKRNLINVRDDIKRLLALAEKDGNLPTTQVKQWLREVEDFILEMNFIQEGTTAKKKKFSRCFFRCCLRHSRRK